MKNKHKKKKQKRFSAKKWAKYQRFLAREAGYTPQTGQIAGCDVVRCKVQTAKPMNSDGMLDIKRMLEIMEQDEKAFGMAG